MITFKGVDVLPLTKDVRARFANQIRNFQCGNSSMSNYLRQSAYFNHITFDENTSIFIKDEILIGYMALKMDKIKIDKVYHTLEIKRVATSTDSQVRGIGSMILEYSEQIATQCNIRFITVDALYEKLVWYMNRGYYIFSEEDIENSSNLIYIYKDLYDVEQIEDYFDE